MPIEIGEIQAQVDVEPGSAAGDSEPQRIEPPPQALQRWRALARRDDELAQRVCAWGFED
jgi:hypothetical protein